MTKSGKPVIINQKKYYLIEKPGVWWKLKPQASPSGLHIILPDKSQHHYDLEDKKNSSQESKLRLIGYGEPDLLYVQSGQNLYEIEPRKGPKIVPKYPPSEITYFPSGNKMYVKSNSPGWLIVISKEDTNTESE